MTAVLDATAGGKHIWHPESEDADRVVFADRRALSGLDLQPGWECRPDVRADGRRLPFADKSFDLVCFDPPHRITDKGMETLSGVVEKKYGALRAESWQSDLRRAFGECWRVLRRGGTLTVKWAAVHADHDEVLDLAPAAPLYGAATDKGDSDSRWWVFHRPRQPD
jgi:SAM-dependent methyltransferase